MKGCMMCQSLRLLLVSLWVCAGGSDLKPILTAPNKAYVKSQVQFHCEVPGWSSPLTYELRKDPGGLLATEADVKVTFSLQVTERSEGKYYCTLSNGGQTSNAIYLHVVIPVIGAYLSSDPDPPTIYEGERVVLHCLVRKGTHLTFTWYHNKQEVNSSSGLYQLSEDALMVDRARERHAGTYSCTAQNLMPVNQRFSSSRNLNVIVKKHISGPRVSFTVFSNGSSLLANISCHLARGSPPVMFSVLVDGLEKDVKRVDSLEFWSVLPISVGLDMGAAQCKAQTDTQLLVSNPVRLHVVPVGGAVRVMVTYLHDADAVVAAAWLKCIPDRGTFPVFTWFMNHSSIPPEDDTHVVTRHGQLLVLTGISSGYYHCRVRDSFNDSSLWMDSESIFIQKTDLVVTPMEVIALVFCGFLSVAIVAGSYLMFWSIGRRHDSHKHDSNQDVIQLETIKKMDVPEAEVSSESQTVEIKTVVMEFAV